MAEECHRERSAAIFSNREKTASYLAVTACPSGTLLFAPAVSGFPAPGSAKRAEHKAKNMELMAMLLDELKREIDELAKKLAEVSVSL